MTTTADQTALTLALQLGLVPENGAEPCLIDEAAQCLRNQHQRIAELEAQLEAIGAGGVGPQRITSSPEQWESAVIEWHRAAKRLDHACTQWRNLLQSDPEAEIWQAAWDAVSIWARQLQTAYDLGDWLEFWWEECKLSAAPGPATITGQEFALDGLDSLIELLRAHRAMKEGQQ